LEKLKEFIINNVNLYLNYIDEWVYLIRNYNKKKLISTTGIYDVRIE
jgi:hypothetical protein